MNFLRKGKSDEEEKDIRRNLKRRIDVLIIIWSRYSIFLVLALYRVLDDAREENQENSSEKAQTEARL